MLTETVPWISIPKNLKTYPSMNTKTIHSVSGGNNSRYQLPLVLGRESKLNPGKTKVKRVNTLDPGPKEGWSMLVGEVASLNSQAKTATEGYIEGLIIFMHEDQNRQMYPLQATLQTQMDSMELRTEERRERHPKVSSLYREDKRVWRTLKSRPRKRSVRANTQRRSARQSSYIISGLL